MRQEASPRGAMQTACHVQWCPLASCGLEATRNHSSDAWAQDAAQVTVCRVPDAELANQGSAEKLDSTQPDCDKSDFSTLPGDRRRSCLRMAALERPQDGHLTF